MFVKFLLRIMGVESAGNDVKISEHVRAVYRHRLAFFTVYFLKFN